MTKSKESSNKIKTAAIPKTFFEYLKSFGPGFVVILTWLGSGDIISAGVSGGNYGYALMWAMVLALLMRFFFVTTIAKYQLCNQHNEGVLDGLVRLHPLFAPFLLIVVFVIGHINGTYLLAGVGETMIRITGIGTTLQWAIFWVVIGLIIVFRPTYNRAESIFKLFLILLTVSLVGTAIWVGPNVSGILKGTFAFQLPPKQGPFGAMAVAMAMVGAVGGSLMNLVYPYFLEQKGWKGPKYRRLQTYDFMLAIGAMIIFNLAVWTLGAELVHTSGKQIETLNDLTFLLSTVLGESGRILFLLGMFAAVFTSLLGNGLGLGYLGSHALHRWKNKDSNPTTIDYRNQPIYKYIALWIFISPLGWIALNKADFVTLTLLANTFMVLLIPALAGGLWWITASSRMIGPKYKNKWWENLLMAILFMLAIWGTVKAVQSIIEMVSKLF
ncbi:Nramp family divalent metal transporter [Candidatus Neomarinimicrobiota bacterium]